MGTTPWPSSLRIMVDGYEAGPVYATTIQRARDLSEFRLDHGSGWGAAFTVRTTTSAERTTLVGFYNARRGQWDSFPFTAPDDSVTRQVRFAMEALRGVKLGPLVWEYRIELTTVGV
jgi:hypothetical protein